MTIGIFHSLMSGIKNRPQFFSGFSDSSSIKYALILVNVLVLVDQFIDWLEYSNMAISG